jgi:hypothetical protein
MEDLNGWLAHPAIKDQAACNIIFANSTRMRQPPLNSL